jgi:uncharacterized phage-associated protein
MGDIKFEFRLDKLINAIAMFCDRGLVDLTKLKIAKLLYFADKKHLLENGRPILGDAYFCMDLGPVPSFAMFEMSEIITKSEVPSEDATSMHKMLRVKKSLFSKYPHFEAKHQFDPGAFSDSELKVLEDIITRFGNKTARQLVELTHEEPAWKIADEARHPGGRTPIPYELFFEGASQSSRKFLARLKSDFCGEAIPLDSDSDYSEFAASLRSFEIEPEFDLDSDQTRRRATAR